MLHQYLTPERDEKCLWLWCARLPHCRLGYGSVEQRAEASIQSSEAVILHGQLDTVPCTQTHVILRSQQRCNICPDVPR